MYFLIPFPPVKVLVCWSYSGVLFFHWVAIKSNAETSSIISEPGICCLWMYLLLKVKEPKEINSRGLSDILVPKAMPCWHHDTILYCKKWLERKPKKYQDKTKHILRLYSVICPKAHYSITINYLVWGTCEWETSVQTTTDPDVENVW